MGQFKVDRLQIILVAKKYISTCMIQNFGIFGHLYPSITDFLSVEFTITFFCV